MKKTGLLLFVILNIPTEVLSDKIIDNFEDGNTMNMFGGSWNGYDDRTNGGKSIANFKIDTATGANGSTKSGFASYILNNTSPNFYAGINCNLGEVTLSGKMKLDFTNISGLQLWLKGNGKPLDVIFASTADPNCNNMAFRINATPAQWTQYTIRIPEDLQYISGLPQIPWLELNKQIVAIQFKSNSNISGESGQIWVDELFLGGSYSIVHTPAITPTQQGQFFYQNFDKELLGVYTGKQLRTFWDNSVYNNGFTDGRCEIVSENAYRGYSLRVKYPQGKIGASESGTQWMNFFSGSYDSLYLQYKLMFSQDFDFSKGGKLPGLAGGTAPSGGDSVDGTNGFSARLMWRHGSGGTNTVHPYISSYVYHMDQPGIYGEDLWWSNPPTEGRQIPWIQDEKVYFKKARWYTIKIFIAINTPGQYNGKIIGWLDGQKVLENKNLRFIAENVDWYKIDLFYFSTFFGGSSSDWSPSLDVYSYFDEIKISTKDPTPPVAMRSGLDEPILPEPIKYSSLNFPNPCSESTYFNFSLLPHIPAVCRILDPLGNTIKIIYNDIPNENYLEIKWILTNDFDVKIKPGVYFYQLIQGSKIITKPFLVVE